MAHRHENPKPIRWYSVDEGAERLSMTASALRRHLERHAVRARDGGTEAHIDGVRGRKFANRWRVSFGQSWAG